MRYKLQAQRKLEELNFQLLSIVRGLETHTLTADQVSHQINQVREKIDNLKDFIELEPLDPGY